MLISITWTRLELLKTRSDTPGYQVFTKAFTSMSANKAKSVVAFGRKTGFTARLKDRGFSIKKGGCCDKSYQERNKPLFAERT